MLNRRRDPVPGPPSEIREVTVTNAEGVHARPVMRLVDVASAFASRITVANVSGTGEELDGKSAMSLMLLDAPKGSVLRIRAWGEDAAEAVDAMVRLIENGFSDPSA
ncbi:MAG: HPr family phosphocarrier protein [Phycisphaerales bacterium]|nr:MAG: HPr family phosphocarrier protein [Phycisphaerales bacterium]